MKRPYAVTLIVILAGCTSPEPPPGVLNRKTLESLPHVATVEITRVKGMPRRQIIHILNWHFVERAAFVADIQTAAEKPLTDAELEQEWASFLDDVESIQSQQEALLRALVSSHGIEAVYLEGIATDQELEGYLNLAARLKDWKEPSGDDVLSEFLRQQFREDSLLLGAASRVDGLEIRPAEDADAMESANPVNGGKVHFDAAARERRESAIVRKVLAEGSPVVVLVLGGGHDLADNVPPGVDVVRVGVTRYAPGK